MMDEIGISPVLLASLQAVAEAENLSAGLRRVLQTVAELIAYDAAEAWMLTEDGAAVRLEEVWFRDDALAPFAAANRHLTLQPGEGLIGKAWEDRTALWRRDIGEDPGFLRRAVAVSVGLRAAVAVPVIASDRVLAMLAFFSRTACDEDQHVVEAVSAVAGVLGLAVQRRWIEAVLLEREAVLQSLFDSSPQAILAVGPDGRIQRANAQAEVVFGYDRDELSGVPLESLVPPRLRSQHGQHLTRFFADPRKRPMGAGMELLAVRKDGSEFTLDIDLTPVGTTPRPVVMAVVHDLTERREARRRFRRVLESAPDGMLLVGRDGHIVLANRHAESMFGYERRALVGLPVDDLVPPADRARHRLGVTAFFAAPRVMHLGGDVSAVHGLRRDGTTFPLELDLGPLETQEAGLVALTSIRDLTARREHEQERERLLHELTQSREQLRVLSARLLDAHETERRTIARELHDQVGQALTAVTLDLQFMRRNVGADHQSAVEETLVNVRRIVAQVRDLSLELRPSMLDDLGLAATMRWYLARQQRHGLEARFVDECGDQRVAASVETACFRITQEAVTNALRHANATVVSVELRAANGDLTLVVTDDGVGFDAQAARAHAVAGGTMGLLGMEERATLVGGRLALDTAVGTGTSVRVWFPL